MIKMSLLTDALLQDAEWWFSPRMTPPIKDDIDVHVFLMREHYGVDQNANGKSRAKFSNETEMWFNLMVREDLMYENIL